MNYRLIVAIALLILIGVFVVMNLEDAKVWFFGARAEMPIALLVIVSGALGFVSGWLFTIVRASKAEKTPANPAPKN